MELPPKHIRFTHTPLNFKNKEIRLITIQPSPDPSSPIQIALKKVDFSGHSNAIANYHEEVAELIELSMVERLDVRTQYMATYNTFLQGMSFGFRALSYTWGPELPAQDILVTSPECHGWLSVRQNLYEFLKIKRDWLSVRQTVDEFLEVGQDLGQFPETGQKLAPAVFWIDQICINQGMNDEKAHQVYQMADIYSAASVVEAWLGPEFEGSDKLVDLIVCESYLSRQFPPPKLSVSEQKMREYVPSLRHFLRLPYWPRLWITQEIVLGRVVHIRIGSRTLLWDTFYQGWLRLERAWECLDKIGKDKELEHEDGRLSCRIHEIDMNRGASLKSWLSIGKSLVRGLECSNVRDRVFGMMGMLEPSLRVFPDYSMHPQEILLEILNKEFADVSARVSADPNEDEPMWSIRDHCFKVAAQWLPQLEDNEHKINLRKVVRHIFSIVPICSEDFHYADWRMYVTEGLDSLPEKLRWLSLIVPRNLEPAYRIGRTFKVKRVWWGYITSDLSKWRYISQGRGLWWRHARTLYDHDKYLFRGISASDERKDRKEKSLPPAECLFADSDDT